MMSGKCPNMPSVIQMREYLVKDGWSYDGEDGGWARFVRKSNRGWVSFGKAHATAEYRSHGDGSSTLSTQLFDNNLDLDVRCIDLVAVLSFVEDRSEDDIVKDILS